MLSLITSDNEKHSIDIPIRLECWVDTPPSDGQTQQLSDDQTQHVHYEYFLTGFVVVDLGSNKTIKSVEVRDITDCQASETTTADSCWKKPPDGTIEL